MTTDERLEEVVKGLKELTDKIEYQTKLFEEAFLSKDETTAKAREQHSNAMKSLHKVLEDNPALKDSPIVAMLMPIIKSVTPAEA